MPATFESPQARPVDRNPPVSTTIVDLIAELVDMVGTIGRLFVKESRDNVARAVERMIGAALALGFCLIGAAMILVAVQALLAAGLANIVSQEAAGILSPTILGTVTLLAGWITYRYFRREISRQSLTPERSMEALDECRQWLRRKTSKGNS